MMVKLGYIHSNSEEQANVLRVLKMTSEPVALDELGIGRIRDAFADLMFPGTSTLQKHIKYFSLMPQLYKKATEKSYNHKSEVKAEIVRLEKEMTRRLMEGSPGESGITGIESIKKGSNNYVKYDPAYIYNSGLMTFNILRSPKVHELIYSVSKTLHNSPKSYKTEDENVANDATEKLGLYNFCSFPSVDYDFTKKCSLNLTKGDRDFIVEHILKAKACSNTLLRFLVENTDFALPQKFEDFPSKELPKNLSNVQDAARRFADFIYMVHVRYNYILSKYEDEDVRNKFNELLSVYINSGADISSILNVVTLRYDDGSKVFCERLEKYIQADDIESFDNEIVTREKNVKKNRRKIGNPSSYVYSKNNRIHYYKLTYRWEVVRKFIEELRKGG